LSLSSLHWATNHYRDHHFDSLATKILPGEYYATAGAEVVVTVLGSCVAACIRDPVSGIGGMNHFLLPDNGTSDVGTSARYGAFAMELLINELLAMGAIRGRLQAKVFGGGNVIAGMVINDVGRRNAEFVEQYLSREGIPVVARDLMGSLPRKVYFFPETGEVLVKKLRSVKNDTILMRERSLRDVVARESTSGGIELFT
jgi:chemotaxis protein CheD